MSLIALPTSTKTLKIVAATRLGKLFLDDVQNAFLNGDTPNLVLLWAILGFPQIFTHVLYFFKV